MEKAFCAEKVRGCEKTPEYVFKLKSNLTADITTELGASYNFCLKHAFLESIRHTYWSEKAQGFVSNFSVSEIGLKGLFKKRRIFEYFAQEILKLIFQNLKDNQKVFTAKTSENGETVKLFGPGINLGRKYTMDDAYMTSFFLALGGIDDMQTMFVYAGKKENNEKECREYISSMLKNHTRIASWIPIPPVSELHKLKT